MRIIRFERRCHNPTARGLRAPPGRWSATAHRKAWSTEHSIPSKQVVPSLFYIARRNQEEAMSQHVSRTGSLSPASHSRCSCVRPVREGSRWRGMWRHAGGVEKFRLSNPIRPHDAPFPRDLSLKMECIISPCIRGELQWEASDERMPNRAFPGGRTIGRTFDYQTSLTHQGKGKVRVSGPSRDPGQGI